MSERRISAELARHIARLAHLELGAEELEALRTTLAQIVEHVAELDTVDVSEVAPTVHPVDLRAPLRKDLVQPSLTVEEALSGAPCVVDGTFAVPRVMDGDR